MTARSLPVWSVIGLAAGIAAGIFLSRGDGGTAPRPAIPGHRPVAVKPGDSAPPPAFSTDDERIVRIFSALQEPVRLRQRLELFEAMRDLTAADMAALMKHAESLPKAIASDLVMALAERWFELDPRAAADWARASSMEWPTTQIWAKADPDSAFRAASTADKWWWSSLLSAALAAKKGDDGAAQLAKARTLPPGRKRDSAFAWVIRAWAERDPAAALAALDEIPAGPKRDDLRDSLLKDAAERAPAWTLAKVNEILPTLKAGLLGNDLVTQIAAKVAGNDPRLAMDWLSGLPVEFRTAPSVRIAGTWAKKEPLAALEWCMANGVDATRADWQGFSQWNPAMLGTVMEKAPVEAFARFAALPPGTERDRLLECAFMESMWHTPGEQLFGNGEWRAWEFYDQLPEDAQVVKASLFGEKRAGRGDLNDLGAWAQNFPSAAARANAVSAAMSASYRRDATRADTLLATTAPGPDRDAALRGLSEAMAPAAPAAAAGRALGIGDGAARRDALESVIVPWLTRAPEAGGVWLQSAGSIPAAWKQEWLAASGGGAEK